MRKPYRHKKKKLQKRILRNHARKQERMRVRFKQNRKLRNKLLQEKNKEQCNLYKRFRDFKRVKAPMNFSLIENTNESLIFISKIESCLSAKKKVFVNLSKKPIKSLLILDFSKNFTRTTCILIQHIHYVAIRY